jgi:hypothetical protein
MIKWSWQNIKIIITMGVYLTRGPSGPDPRQSEQRGRPTGPTPWSASQGLRWFDPSLGCHVSTRGGEAWVVGGHSTRPASHVAWLAGHHVAPNRPLQVNGGPIHPYKYPPPLTVKVEIPHSTCNSPLVKGFSLVVVAQVKPCQESRVELSRVESSLELWK